jgi:TPP-dependent pyruvate/acetoin dehydrogenase alpha subunit
VRAAADNAVARARRGEGPTLLECRTYRFVGHFTAERALGIRYRGADEIAEWKKRDPIDTFPAWLEREGQATPEETEAVRREVEGLMEDAIAFARESPFPPAESALDGMYATPYPNLPARGF